MPESASVPDGRAFARLLVLGAVLGIGAAVAASVFLAVVGQGTALVYERIPNALGLGEEPPGWWAALVLMAGVLVVLAARRLPGATGEGPLSGFHFDVPARNAPAIVLAAFGTLIFGFALGPEAPLIVLGSAIGAVALRGGADDARRAAMALGGLAAIGAVFGNPFVTAFMVLEFAALGALPAVMILPALVALGSGYIVQIGLWEIPGVGVHALAVPGLAVYDSIGAGDLALGVAVAVGAGAIALLARELGVGVANLAIRRSVSVLIGAALVTGGIAIVADHGLGIPLDQILFSGNAGMSGLIAETSIVVVVVILAGKAIAYGVALGGGLRGGPIFPATFLGVGAGVLAALVVPSAEATPLVAVGIAASAAAMTRLPATSGLLAMLLIGGAGAAIAPFAIIGAVVGLLMRLGLDGRREPASAAPTDV